MIHRVHSYPRRVAYDDLFRETGGPFLPRTTLGDMFPGNMGRLQFVRIMLRLLHPGLDEWPWDRPLEIDLLEKIKDALERDQKG